MLISQEEELLMKAAKIEILKLKRNIIIVKKKFVL